MWLKGENVYVMLGSSVDRLNEVQLRIEFIVGCAPPSSFDARSAAVVNKPNMDHYDSQKDNTDFINIAVTVKAIKYGNGREHSGAAFVSNLRFKSTRM